MDKQKQAINKKILSLSKTKPAHVLEILAVR